MLGLSSGAECASARSSGMNPIPEGSRVMQGVAGLARREQRTLASSGVVGKRERDPSHCRRVGSAAGAWQHLCTCVERHCGGLRGGIILMTLLTSWCTCPASSIRVVRW